MDLRSILEAAIETLDRYPGAQTTIELKHNHETYDSMHLLLHQIEDAVRDQRGDPNLPAARGRLWYQLLRESRGQGRAPILDETRMKLTHWLRSHYARLLPAFAATPSRRFSVALSFPREHRNFVLAVAEALAAQLTRERVFYDEWCEVELLGAGGDLKLQSVYENTDLVVPFFSEHYDKPWCSMEWETIRGILRNRRNDDAVIPVHLDDTAVPGWPAVNFGIRLRGRTPQKIGEIILEALAMRVSATGIPTNQPPATTSSASSSPITDVRAEPPATDALSIWKEKVDYLQQQEAIESSAAQIFTLKKQIEQAQKKILELGGNPK